MRKSTWLCLSAGLLLPLTAYGQAFNAAKPTGPPPPPKEPGPSLLQHGKTLKDKIQKHKAEEAAACGNLKEACIDQQFDLCKYNKKLQGRVIDYTQNHGCDRRILSKALMERRDLYVYLPPGYSNTAFYPCILYMHGVFSDEKEFVLKVAPMLDEAILKGEMPPVIVAAPDGSLNGTPERFDPATFFINGPAGDFQDYVTRDVWTFVTSRYNVRPEPEAHILAGVSMGGFGAFNTAIKYRNDFQTVVGVLPVLNLRWMNTKGDYHADFDPYDWGWRNSAYDPEEVLASYYAGLLKVKVKDLIYPIFGAGPNGVMLASWENPIELIDRCCLRQGELAMFIAYAGLDEFNLDAHAESFLYMLKSRGITASVYVDPEGTHGEATAMQMMDPAFRFIAKRLRACGLDRPLVLPSCDTPCNQPVVTPAK